MCQQSHDVLPEPLAELLYYRYYIGIFILLGIGASLDISSIGRPGQLGYFLLGVWTSWDISSVGCPGEKSVEIFFCWVFGPVGIFLLLSVRAS